MNYSLHAVKVLKCWTGGCMISIKFVTQVAEISLCHMGLTASPWSWLKLLCFLMCRASLSLLRCHCCSLLITVLLLQSILWSSSMACCATANFCDSRFLQQRWCSFSRTFSVLQVFPMYERSQSIQEMQYTTPVASVGSVLGFTLVRRDLSVLPDRNIILIPTLEQILLIFSLTSLT